MASRVPETSKPASAESALLSVRNLRTHFATPAGTVKAVDDVSFDLGRDDILAIVGESGSGKSVTALSIMKLVPTPPGRYVSGRAIIDGIDLMTLRARDLVGVRGAKLAMIFQNPRAALNPSFTVRAQLVETLRRHDRESSKIQTEQRMLKMMRSVGFSDPERVAQSYPHHLSGGMCQRIGLALAFACDPAVLIADEPTTALDVVVQARILHLLGRVHRERRLPILIITHDFGVVRAIANRVIVMYAGKIQETGSVDQILTSPQHPYTRALIASVPDPERTAAGFYQIRGQPPDLLRLPRGCKFADRCDYVMPICRSVEAGMSPSPSGSSVRCHMFPQAGEQAA
ncbi:MAG: ABC transporter ATP-binding protein [Pseudomonadota bacterium]|nr:ABC transporter ATP-binding protein [Pseudomonadota bacterium]